MIKQMNLSGDERKSDYRVAGRRALQGILEVQMRDRIDCHLEEIVHRGKADGRNGNFSQHLLTELGDIELHVARIYSPVWWRLSGAFGAFTSLVSVG